MSSKVAGYGSLPRELFENGGDVSAVGLVLFLVKVPRKIRRPTSSGDPIVRPVNGKNPKKTYTNRRDNSLSSFEMQLMTSTVFFETSVQQIKVGRN